MDARLTRPGTPAPRPGPGPGAPGGPGSVGVRGALLAGALLLLGWAAPGRAASWPQGVPRTPQAPVTDLAGLFSPAAVQDVDARLRQEWRAGHFQLAVLTLPSLGRTPIEDCSIAVARGWGLGGRKESNGVLLLIAAKEHAMRIEVGSRLEGGLPDLVCWRIIREVMAPRMRQGDADGALEAGVAAIIQVLAPQDAQAGAPGAPGTFSGDASGSGLQGAAGSGPPGAGQGQGGLGAAVASGGLLALLFWLLGQPLLWILLLVLISALLNGLGGGGFWGGGFGGFGGFGGGGFGGGGFGGGGFGGGGGGFSGGGASGGW